MIEFFKSLDSKVQSAIIAGLFSTMAFLLGWFFKVIYDRYSLNFRLNKEFTFEQKKSVKQQIAKTKTPILNAAEEFNSRLWNFIDNIDQNWHSIPRNKWLEPKSYYLRTFVYRLLVFIYWVLEIEKSLIHFDSTIADKKDLDYIKYLKTFKNTLCDTEILEDLNYSSHDNINHFYKNELIIYTNFIKDENGDVIDYDTFYAKLKEDYKTIEKVFIYINNIENDVKDKSLNVLRCFHLLLIQFLTEYGHDYQKTDKKKTQKLIDEHYHNIKIKNSFRTFLGRNKMESEMKMILRKLGNSVIKL
jgi:hypothetical protein